MAERRWISHSSSALGEAEENAVREVVAGNFIGHGPKAIALEGRISEATHRKHAFSVSSGFHALALAVRALDLPQPSLVALPVLTCASVLAAVQGAGHQVWLADIHEEDLTLDPMTISRDAAAVVAPHAYGAPVDAEALRQLGVPWIEDCATSPATRVMGQPAGSSGTFAVFSFGSTKYLTGGAGGMLLTDDDRLAARVNDLLDFDDFGKRGEWKHGIPAAMPGRLADLNAAVALVQWEQFPTFAARRRAIAEIYQTALDNIPGLKLPRLCPERSFYRYIVQTSAPATTLAAALHKQGIDARHSVNPWLYTARQAGHTVLGGPWPVAARCCGHLLSLPIYAQLSEAEAHWVAKGLKELLTK
jgi:dTDP-4-amino-4,6-dideoxygalactose transaminase